MIEVLATVIASPKFLYLVQADSKQQKEGKIVSVISNWQRGCRCFFGAVYRTRS